MQKLYLVRGMLCAFLMLFSLTNYSATGISDADEIIETSGGCTADDMAFVQLDCADNGGGVLPVFNMTFFITGDCYVDDFYFQADDGGYDVLNLPDLGFFLYDGDDINLINTIEDAVYDIYWTTSDGSISPVFEWVNGNCSGEIEGCTNPYADNYNSAATVEDGSCTYSETICDCNGNEHTIGVLVWLGDTFADDNDYQWDGVDVSFNCDTWGYDCGDILGAPTDDPYDVCGGNLPPDNGCFTGGCTADDMVVIQQPCEDNGSGLLPVFNMTYFITGDCYVEDLFFQVDGGGFVSINLPDNGFFLYDGDNIDLVNTTADSTYELYFTTNDGAISPIVTFENGNCSGEIEGCTDPAAVNYNSAATVDDGSCIYDDFICDCNGVEHSIGVLAWLGDGFEDDNDYEWEGQLVSFNCDTWGYDCGDIPGAPTDDPYNVCGGDLPPNNGCDIGGDCSFNPTLVWTDGCVNDVDVMYFEFDYVGDCLVDEICAESTFDAQLICFDISLQFLGSGDVWGISGLDTGLWDFYYTLDDGSTSPVASMAIESCLPQDGCTNEYAVNYDPDATNDDGSCIYDETICDCAGTEHTIGVLAWIGDGFADNDDYEWDGQLVNFNCDTWGYDCGDILGAPTDDPYNVCNGGLPPNNGCESTGDCSYNPTIVYIDGCTNDVDVMFFEFDFNGGCTVVEICAESTFDAQLICFDISGQNLGDGDVWGISGLDEGIWDFYYTLSDGSTSPTGTLQIASCVVVEGCTNEYAVNYDPTADLDDGSCIYDDTICDCAGTEHTIGVMVWIGDGFADDGGFDWDGQPVDFNCDTWGYDCGDILGAPTDDPYGVCDGGIPVNNGCIDDCVGTEVTIEITTDCWGEETSWSLENDSGFVIESVSSNTLGDETTYTYTLCLADDCYTFFIDDTYGDGMYGSQYTECTTDGSYIIYDEDGNVLADIGLDPDFGFGTSHDFCLESEVPGCVDFGACNYDPDATVDDGSCDYSCYGCTDDTACNYDPDATVNDGSCDYSCYGCTDISACNYDADATIDNGSCDYSCYGCTDDSACNYDEDATIDNGSCDYSCYGCTDPGACNYDDEATIDNGSCDYTCLGCTDDTACNYDPDATIDNGSCDYSCYGCTDITACNFDPDATIDNGSCDYNCYGCTDSGACNYEVDATIDDGSCDYSCLGCTDPEATNYDSTATIDDGSCVYGPIFGCTDQTACNYNQWATNDDGSCDYSCFGCTDSTACNYDPEATIEDGSCEYETCAGCTDSTACNYDSTATLDDGTCEYESCAGCTDSAAINYDPDATIDDGSCIYDCEYPTIEYSTYCDGGNTDVFYVEMVISDLGNGAPYSVSNNQNGDEISLTFNGTINLGPFDNNASVVITVESDPLAGCFLTSPVLTDDCTVSVEELDALVFGLYPNPSEGHFTVESGNYTGAVLFNCYDLSGRLVYSQQTNVNRGEMTEVILGEDLAGGSYFFQIATDQGMVTKQIVIQK